MPNTGSKRPEQPLPVLVRDERRPTLWALALMREWRWLDESAGTWEASVARSAADYEWVAGTRLRRVGSAASDAVNRAASQ